MLWGPEDLSDPLKLELWKVVSYHMGARDQIWILSREKQLVLLTSEPSLQPIRGLLKITILKNNLLFLSLSEYVISQ